MRPVPVGGNIDARIREFSYLKINFYSPEKKFVRKSMGFADACAALCFIRGLDKRP